MRRPHPAAVVAGITLGIALLDAGVFLFPATPASAESDTNPGALAIADAHDAFVIAPDQGVLPDFPEAGAVTPSPAPTPSLNPTPTPTPAIAAPFTPLPTPTPTPKPTAKPTPRDTVTNARAYVKARIGMKQYNCVNAIWTKESGWDPRAGTPSGAYGIPQAYPGSKMAVFGSNWRYSPLTQVKWGIWYVNDRYGSACAAYEFFEAYGWY